MTTTMAAHVTSHIRQVFQLHGSTPLLEKKPLCQCMWRAIVCMATATIDITIHKGAYSSVSERADYYYAENRSNTISSANQQASHWSWMRMAHMNWLMCTDSRPFHSHPTPTYQQRIARCHPQQHQPIGITLSQRCNNALLAWTEHVLARTCDQHDNDEPLIACPNIFPRACGWWWLQSTFASIAIWTYFIFCKSKCWPHRWWVG